MEEEEEEEAVFIRGVNTNEDPPKGWSRRITLYYQIQVSPQGTGSEHPGLGPSFLSKIETHLLASLGSKGKNRNSLTCLRNAGF